MIKIKRVYWLTIMLDEGTVRLYPNSVQLCPSHKTRFTLTAAFKRSSPNSFARSPDSQVWLESQGLSASCAYTILTAVQITLRGQRSSSDASAIAASIASKTAMTPASVRPVRNSGVVIDLRTVRQFAPTKGHDKRRLRADLKTDATIIPNNTSKLSGVAGLSE